MLRQALSDIWNRIAATSQPRTMHRSLSEAAEVGDLSAVKFWLLERKANPDELDSYGYFPLINAALSNKLDSINQLIAAGADVNLQGPHGYTALHAAAQNGFYDISKALVDAGANVNIRNNDRDTALILATRQRHVQVVNLLARSGGNPRLLGYNRQSSIEIARSEGLFGLASTLSKLPLFQSDLVAEKDSNEPDQTASMSTGCDHDSTSSLSMLPSMATYFIPIPQEDG